MQRSSLESVRARPSSAESGRISSGCTARACCGTVSSVNAIRIEQEKRIGLLRRLHHSLAPGRLRRANAQPPVREREPPAYHHYHRAKPDQQHQRLVIEPHRERTIRIELAERQIELAHTARHQG